MRTLAMGILVLAALSCGGGGGSEGDAGGDEGAAADVVDEAAVAADAAGDLAVDARTDLAAGDTGDAGPSDPGVPSTDVTPVDTGSADAGFEGKPIPDVVVAATPVGGACSTGEGDCPLGVCIDGMLDASLGGMFAGGYCTAFCSLDDPSGCGAGAACFAVDLFPPVCAKVCRDDGDCREPGYVCAGSCVPASFVSVPETPGIVTLADTTVGGRVAAVDLARVAGRIAVLSGAAPWQSPDGPVTIRSRSSGHPDHAVAIAYLLAELGALGLDAQTVPFDADGKTGTNVTAVIPGADATLPEVVVLAHYDSTTDGDLATTPAPGASDNGSGVAIALEIATLLAAADAPTLPRPVRILLTDREESGLHGARAFVQAAWQGNGILCALNVDMVGQSSAAMAGRYWYQFAPSSEWIAGLGAEAVAAFAPEALPAFTTTDMGGSDSGPFLEYGECVVGFFAWPRHPANHTQGDVIGELQPQFLHGVARSAVAVATAWVLHGE